MNPARAVYESWLLEAAEGRLAGWKAPLLKRALRRDLGLRCLAMELLEFECEGTEGTPALDLRPRLRAHVLADVHAPERPLFPSAWIPAGAIAALLITAVVALGVHQDRGHQGEASVQPAGLLDPDLQGATQAPKSAALVKDATAAPLTAGASLRNAQTAKQLPLSPTAGTQTPDRPKP
jgi:hypothetical protein